MPSTTEDWKRIEQGFRTKWNFPGCIGAIDGKHVNIKAPANCGSDFFNYKGCNSIVLLALVDDDYCFSYIDVGCNGRASDGSVFANCSLFNILKNKTHHIPKDAVIVGDEGFGLTPYLMKPYPSRGVIEKRKKKLTIAYLGHEGLWKMLSEYLLQDFVYSKNIFH